MAFVTASVLNWHQMNNCVPERLLLEIHHCRKAQMNNCVPERLLLEIHHCQKADQTCPDSGQLAQGSAGGHNHEDSCKTFRSHAPHYCRLSSFYWSRIHSRTCSLDKLMKTSRSLVDDSNHARRRGPLLSGHCLATNSRCRTPFPRGRRAEKRWSLKRGGCLWRMTVRSDFESSQSHC